MNFVFLFADELCASALQCYGNPFVKTPHLDRVAREGTRFDQCYAQNPVCSPSRCSLMTGTYVHNRGHRTLWHLLRREEPSLFRYLKQAGYEIAWCGKNDLYSGDYLKEICGDGNEKRANAKDKGDNPEPGTFSSWESVTSGTCAFPPEHPAAKAYLYDPGTVKIDKIPLDPYVGEALSYIQGRQEGDQPFFLYLPLDLPHPPYTICEPYYSMYDPKTVGKALAEPVESKPCYEALIRQYRNLDKVSENVFDQIYAVYLGMVSYVDAMLGELDRVLEKKGLKEETVLIISSDHGDWHGTRRLVEKWPNAMDDELIHVPLIIRMPEGKKGHVVKEQVELFDIMATVLELAGVEARHDHFAKSLVRQLYGDSGDPHRAVFCEGGYDIREPHCFEGYQARPVPAYEPGDPRWIELQNSYGPKRQIQQEHPSSVCRSTMIRTPEYKLVRRTSGEHELYDLKKDPGEIHNLYDMEPTRLVRLELESRLLQWYQETSDTVPWEEDLR